MRHYLTLILLAVFLVSLGACGKKGEVNPPADYKPPQEKDRALQRS